MRTTGASASSDNIDRLDLSGRPPFAFFSDRRPESITKEVAGHHFHCLGIGYRITGGATITAVRGSCTTAVVTDPSVIPANRTQPWLPTSASWVMSDRSQTRQAVLSGIWRFNTCEARSTSDIPDVVCGYSFNRQFAR